MARYCVAWLPTFAGDAASPLAARLAATLIGGSIFALLAAATWRIGARTVPADPAARG